MKLIKEMRLTHISLLPIGEYGLGGKYLNTEEIEEAAKVVVNAYSTPPIKFHWETDEYIRKRAEFMLMYMI